MNTMTRIPPAYYLKSEVARTEFAPSFEITNEGPTTYGDSGPFLPSNLSRGRTTLDSNHHLMASALPGQKATVVNGTGGISTAVTRPFASGGRMILADYSAEQGEPQLKRSKTTALWSSDA